MLFFSRYSLIHVGEEEKKIVPTVVYNRKFLGGKREMEVIEVYQYTIICCLRGKFI